MKDQQILALLKTENYSKATEKLYAYFPVIKKLVLKNSGTRQDAEDIYQEALIILIQKTQVPGFVLSSSLNTYLYSICRFLWSDQLKKKNKSITVEPVKETVLPVEEELAASLQNEQQQRLAEKAFEQLGEKCRQLLQLFYFHKISLKDIALKLRFSSEKVAKNQKYRCLEKAKENLTALKLSSHE